MNSDFAPVDGVTLPRHAVLEILHHAQTAPNGISQGLLMRGGDDRLELLPISTVATPKALAVSLAADQRQAMAFYRSSMESAGAAHGDEAADWLAVVPLYLSVSLGTRGVLELRAWRRDHDHLKEIEVDLGEDPPPPQGKGTSKVA